MKMYVNTAHYSWSAMDCIFSGDTYGRLHDCSTWYSRFLHSGVENYRFYCCTKRVHIIDKDGYDDGSSRGI